MRTTKYRVHSDSIAIPFEITADRDKDFYITLYNRIQHDRKSVDLDSLYMAFAYHHDYEEHWKMYAINQALKTYGYYSKMLRTFRRHERQHEVFMKKVSKYENSMKRRTEHDETERHINS